VATKANKGKLDSDAETPKAGRYRVAAGTQVAAEERLYAEGEMLDAPEGVVSEWLVLGLVEEVEPKAKRSKSPS
jgi:hypothetical protein